MDLLQTRAPLNGRTQAAPLHQMLGDAQLRGWTGLQPVEMDEHSWQGAATLKLPGEAVFRFPDGERGWYKHGLRIEHDGSADWRHFYGLQLEIHLNGDQSVELEASVSSAHPETVTATMTITGQGWHTVMLPWSVFQFEQARTAFLKHVKEVRLKVMRSAEATTQNENQCYVQLCNVRAVRGETLALQCEVRGKSAPRGQNVEYSVIVGNCTDQPQAVTLLFERYGWEAMTATVEPSRLELAPDESQTVTVRVQVSERVPPGGHEKQLLRAGPNGDGTRASTLTFITASQLPHPYILHTPQRWQEVRDKIQRYEWAQATLEEIVLQAETWHVTQIAQPPHNDPDDTHGPFLFRTKHEHNVMACAIAWQLTSRTRYARKAAEFLRRLSDPEHGYPVTLRACNQSLVQEGHFFQHMAMAYDMILDADVLSVEDQAQIEHTFRLLIETMDQANRLGAINNWNISEIVGAFYCALAMQDLVTAERFFSGPSGIVDQLAKGTMDDGWWYECSISYNLWCATEFCQVALAYEPFGINFRDMKVPASYSLDVSLSAPDGRTELSGGKVTSGAAELNSLRNPFGMSKEIWGPLRRPYREIRDMWNGLLPFVDYRGVIFGVNDSVERHVPTNHIGAAGTYPFEIAYYVYRDPAYAAMVKLAKQRDLLYSVPELPEKTPELYRESAYADNVGVAMLRSQTPNRPIREQIQAVLHYGTHGWAHGHFDRTSLLSLMRYGRSFYNPEAVWYVYEPFMYKFYVQTSVSQNMVVVDQKMQEAVESHRLLFHSGQMMQVAAVQTEARWSNPPYGGMVYDYVPVNTFEEKCWREGRHVPIPEDAPDYGSLTDFTEPILQRRLMVVTDDYVVLADYLKGDENHTFENLFQMKGFQGLEAAQKTFLRHDPQWNPDPVGSAQFVTDCLWFGAEAPARSRFEMKWGPGADNEGTLAPHSENGVLKLDVHSLWPPQQEIMVGTAPEQHHVEKRLFYTVRGSDEHGASQVLAEGKFGAWILGQAEIDVSVENLIRLDLETETELAQKPTIFWANAHVVTRDGAEIPLSQLPMTFDNVVQPSQPGKDYFGGPIKIVGVRYEQATPGEPEDKGRRGIVRVDLSGVDAVRFKAVIGGDFPLGGEAQRRKTYAIRTQGQEARFLTIIEPYENQNMIRHAEAMGADKVRVELADGRVQEITIRNLEGDGDNIAVHIVEMRNGELVRVENTVQS